MNGGEPQEKEGLYGSYAGPGLDIGSIRVTWVYGLMRLMVPQSKGAFRVFHHSSRQTP